MSEKSARIDALRGCAIFAVLQYHYCEVFGLYARVGLPAPIHAALACGWAGVDLFFVLSAFLLTRNLLGHRGEARATEIFYRRRILRILPLYLLLLGLAAGLTPLLGAGRGEAGEWLLGGLAPFWAYGLFLQNFWSGLYGWSGHFLAPSWSLAVEEHFYLLLPLLVLRSSGARIAQLALGAIVASPLLRAAIDAGAGETAAQTWTFGRADSFGWGMLIALALSHGESAVRLLAKVWIAAAAVLAALVAVHGSTGSPFAYSVTALVCAALTLAAAGPLRFTDWRFTNWPFTTWVFTTWVFTTWRGGALFEGAAWMGARCYSIYLLHMPIAGLMALAMGRPTPSVVDAASFLAVPAAAVVTLIVANLSYRFIERPFIAYGERHAAYRDAAPARVDV